MSPSSGPRHMTDERPVMILAGGTGGHIFPGLAVAQALRDRGVPVAWLGAAGRMEARLVPQYGIALDTIEIAGVRGKGALALLAMPFRMLGAVRQARALLRARGPRAVVSFGGFAAGPGGLAARLLGLPLIVHEQNRAPGLTNRVLARLARRVLEGFPQSFRGVAAQTVGNPVRAEISALPPPRERLAAREGAVHVLVLGGSQGAHILNVAFPQALGRLPQTLRPQVRHQCGERHLERARRVYAAAKVEAGIEPFIADMAAAYAWADLVVCRAGALTLAELCAAGLGGVLIPFPQAVDDHQTRNAEYLAERGAAVLVAEGEDFEARLLAALRPLLEDGGKRLAMAEAARALARPDAAADVAEIVLKEAA